MYYHFFYKFGLNIWFDLRDFSTSFTREEIPISLESCRNFLIYYRTRTIIAGPLPDATVIYCICVAGGAEVICNRWDLEVRQTRHEIMVSRNLSLHFYNSPRPIFILLLLVQIQNEVKMLFWKKKKKIPIA